MLKKTILFLLLVATYLPSFSKENKSDLDNLIDTINVLSKKILYGKSDTEKLLANTKLILLLKEELNKPNSFTTSFDSLHSIFQFTAKDKSFRIFNWNVPLANGTRMYEALVQTKVKARTKNKKEAYQLFQLVNKSADIIKPENTVCEYNNWIGAQYYKVIVTNYKKKTYYTLLGMDWNDKLSHKKIIDVFFIDGKGKPKFGSNLFKAPRTFRQRYIFEYTARASMTLNYDENEKNIVFDHLSPPTENLIGNYQFYGPDGSFDFLKFEKGKWVYIDDLDARNRKSKKDKLYNAPTEEPKPQR